jgi:hypothetical protein
MLKDEIETAKRLVTTDTVQITIGEIGNMYVSRELNINPEFQRLFRWTPQKKSNFIESILIGIPIPPAFSYEKDDGTWELIDGLQRISTVLEFMGLLRKPESDALESPSKLVAATYLPALKDVVWTDGNEEADTTPVILDKSLQLFFRRARIDFQVLKHPSDPKTKFDLFQRLNRGGAYANEQEVRSCAMVMANSDFTKKIRDFSAQDDFKNIFRITNDQVLSQDDIQNAVRFIVHTHREYQQGNDVQEFLTTSILDILLKSKPRSIIEPVRWATATLNRLFGSRALIPSEDAPDDIANRFTLRALEAIAVGIARNKTAITSLDNNGDDFLRNRVSTFWSQPEVREMSSRGLRGTTRLQKSIPFGSSWFKPNG